MDFSAVTLIIMLLSTSGVTLLIKAYLEKDKTRAGTIKLRNEAGQIVLEGELKVTEFYRKHLEDLMEKYNVLEERLDQEIADHRACQERIGELEIKHMQLQKDFDALRLQLGS